MDRGAPLEITVGQPYAHVVRFTDADGEPEDVSDTTFASHLRLTATDPEPLAIFGIDMDQASDGVVVFTLDAETTEGLLATGDLTAIAEWDIIDPQIVARGLAHIRRSVTHG